VPEPEPDTRTSRGLPPKGQAAARGEPPSNGRVMRERLRHEDPKIAQAIDDLVKLLPPGTKNQDLVAELVTHAVEAPGDGLDRGEMKLLCSAMRDFRHSFRIFGGHRERKKISIFGSARVAPDTPTYDLTVRFARACAERGWMIITGAGPGIMRAGNEGAGRANSFGVNIRLPFEQEPNDMIAGDPKLVDFKYFFTRKLSFVKESDAIVLFPGGFGTMDEGFESLTLLQTGKCDPLPVVLMDVPGGDYWPSWDTYLRENLLAKGLISAPDRFLFRYTTDVDKAVNEIELFYRCYHSLRYVGDYVVLRLKRRPTPELMKILNERYRDLLREGDFEVLPGPHRAERNEDEAVRALPRIGFHFVQRGFGRLRRLIDEINLVEHDEPPVVSEGAEPPAGSGALNVLGGDGDED
jgi:uncharacterized protein (TIGR00730 family)